MRVKRTPIPRNFLWSERFRSSDQTIWALHGMNLPFTSITKGRLWLELSSLDKRMNAPPRLRSSVFPSTRPVGVWITTDHLTLALEWRRLSTFIVFCEGLFVGGFFLVHIQKVWNCCQIYRNGGRKCNKKSPHWPSRPMGAKPEGVGWCRVTESPTLWSVGILSQANRKTTIFWVNRLV